MFKAPTQYQTVECDNCEKEVNLPILPDSDLRSLNDELERRGWILVSGSDRGDNGISRAHLCGGEECCTLEEWSGTSMT